MYTSVPICMLCIMSGNTPLEEKDAVCAHIGRARRVLYTCRASWVKYATDGPVVITPLPFSDADTTPGQSRHVSKAERSPIIIVPRGCGLKTEAGRSGSDATPPRARSAPERWFIGRPVA